MVLYCLVRFVWYHESVTSWTVAGYVFLVATTYATYSWVVSAAEAGGSSEYAMDVLLITLFVQAGLIVSDYFWLVFLAIPGFLLYHGGKLLLKYVFTPDGSEQEDDATIKKKEKAERKAARPKFRRA
ncbi:hypothetical protein PybrP1_002832 [[Pythium] brassicae (nom. inval.)]|nr:hypothetical protein PybrP1_002832 [[Pythium] brassicae (nom. inval.)]